MILIPEIETVIILVPRTGSGSLYRAVLTRYPRAMMPYRHMEADGVPHGYDRWERFGIVRHPLERLWSLYKFLSHFDGDHDSSYIAAMRKSVQRPFDDWLMHNNVVFTSPHDWAGLARYWPFYTVLHAMPENCKSQFLYLRPDLGTEVYRFGDLGAVAKRLNVVLDVHNATEQGLAPPISRETQAYMSQMFKWDYEMMERP